MSRIEQVNELLREELASLIAQEIGLANVLITVNHVRCSPDLRIAKIGVSVLPENVTGTALKQLRKHTSSFSKILRKKTRLRTIPKFVWTIDNIAKDIIESEEMFKNLF